MRTLIFYFFFFLISNSFGCSDSSITPQIYGKWHDLSDYPTQVTRDGIVTYETYPNIFYTFFENDTYTTEGEFEIGVVDDGTFQLSNSNQIVTFMTIKSSQDSLLGIYHSYEWEIIELQEEYMKVYYTYKAILPGIEDPIELSMLREFERVE
ncbi:MAG: hypothetical protein WAT79_13660 [Saprospiraceae bacterium]